MEHIPDSHKGVFLVTGGAGFLGSHLVDKLLEEKVDKVIVFDNFTLGRMENLEKAFDSGKVEVFREDARYLTGLESLIEKERPVAVFDFAVKPLLYGFLDPEGAYMTSVQITSNLLHILKRKLFGSLVHVSSSEAYGTAQRVPMDETHPLNPANPYGAGKAAADLLCMTWGRVFKLPVWVPRPFNAYGPRQNVGTYAAVIPQTIRRILAGELPVIEGDGKQTRDLTYCTDIVDGIYEIMRHEEAMWEPLNLGSGVEITIEDVINGIIRVMGSSTMNVTRAPARAEDVRRLYCDISKAKKLIGYEPKIPYLEGIRRTVHWYKNRG